MWNEVDEIGVPRSADIRLLVRSLQETGVSVSYEGEVPLSDLPAPDGPWWKLVVIIAALVTAYYMGMDFLANKGNQNKPAGNVPVAQDPIPAAVPMQGLPDKSPKRKPPPAPPARSKRPKKPSSKEPSSSFGSSAAEFFGNLAKSQSDSPAVSELPTVPPSYRTWSDATGRTATPAIGSASNPDAEPRP